MTWYKNAFLWHVLISLFILDIEPPKKKQRRCKVTEAEEKIVLQSYELFSTAGWEAVLENVKERVREPMAGNALQANKIKDYYLQTSSNKAALKRIQRIVNQNVQKSLRPHHQSTSTSQTQRMSEIIEQRNTVTHASVPTPSYERPTSLHRRKSRFHRFQRRRPRGRQRTSGESRLAGGQRRR